MDSSECEIAPDTGRKISKNTVFVSYFPPEATKENISCFFQNHIGGVQEVVLLSTTTPIQPWYRTGYVNFFSPENKRRAILLSGLLLENQISMYKITIRCANEVQPVNLTNLLIRNLAPKIPESWLDQTFRKFGLITSARLVRSTDMSDSRAFINFANSASALSAINAMNGVCAFGYKMSIRFSERAYPLNVNIFPKQQNPSTATTETISSSSNNGNNNNNNNNNSGNSEITEKEETWGGDHDELPAYWEIEGDSSSNWRKGLTSYRSSSDPPNFLVWETTMDACFGDEYHLVSLLPAQSGRVAVLQDTAQYSAAPLKAFLPLTVDCNNNELLPASPAESSSGFTIFYDKSWQISPQTRTNVQLPTPNEYTVMPNTPDSIQFKNLNRSENLPSSPSWLAQEQTNGPRIRFSTNRGLIIPFPVYYRAPTFLPQKSTGSYNIFN